MLLHLIFFWYRIISSFSQYIGSAPCLFIPIFAYTKTVFTLRHNQVRVDHVQSDVFRRQPSQAIPLNIVRYRKAVNSALWVQGTLVFCYLPFVVVVAITPQRGITLPIHLATQYTGSVVYLNSSLNPLWYCWNMREVREAVKVTLRQLFCQSS